MRIEEFRELIQEREYIEKISQGEWADGIEECNKKEIDILTENIASTIEFLQKECSAKEFVWISEIIDDLAAKTQSRELIDCYKSLMSKFPDECRIYSIQASIEYAEAELSDGNVDGQD